MEEICNETQEAEATSENDELIFGAKLIEEVLLVLLAKNISQTIGPDEKESRMALTKGRDSFTGGLERSGMGRSGATDWWRATTRNDGSSRAGRVMIE